MLRRHCQTFPVVRPPFFMRLATRIKEHLFLCADWQLWMRHCCSTPLRMHEEKRENSWESLLYSSSSIKNPKQSSSSFQFSETSSVCCATWIFLLTKRKTWERCYYSILVELKIILHFSIENDHLFLLNFTNIFCFHPIII